MSDFAALNVKAAPTAPNASLTGGGKKKAKKPAAKKSSKKGGADFGDEVKGLAVPFALSLLAKNWQARTEKQKGGEGEAEIMDGGAKKKQIKKKTHKGGEGEAEIMDGGAKKKQHRKKTHKGGEGEAVPELPKTSELAGGAKKPRKKAHKGGEGVMEAAPQLQGGAKKAAAAKKMKKIKSEFMDITTAIHNFLERY